jgi:hypothetical protein
MGQVMEDIREDRVGKKLTRKNCGKIKFTEGFSIIDS